jgi:hypothetical protein
MSEVAKMILKTVTHVFMTLTLVAAASAQDSGARSINTGGEKGAYHALFCPPLPDALSNAYFQGYTCTASKGTLDNIDRVLRYPTSIGFVQLDVYADEEIRRLEEFKKLTVIRSDIACEGLWMVTKNPDLKSYGHILALSRRIPFILPAQGSGAAASFAFLQANDSDGLGRVPEANKRYVPDVTAVLNETASSPNGAVGFFVQFADPENANIKLIVEKGLKVIPVASRQVLHIKLNDRGIYQLQTFTLKDGGIFVNPTEATTACTAVAIVTGAPEAFGDNRDKADDQKDMIQKIREVPAEKLLPQQSRIRAVIQHTKILAGQALEEIEAAAEKARQTIEDRAR